MEKVLQQLNDIASKHNTLWFRGHSSSHYKLNSGLYRIDSSKPLVLQKEKEMYHSFVNLGSMYINSFGRDSEKEWNTLFMMQHYGMYTRLLDWTSSFLIALYFANQGRDPSETAAIWVIDPIKLNKSCHNLYENNSDIAYTNFGLVTLDTLPTRISHYTNYFTENIHIKSFALMPRRSNDRLISQQGFFTVQGTEATPLEEEYKDKLGKFIYKIELPPETYESSLKYLKLNSVDYHSVYGGIDGLCKYIKNELLNIKLNNI